MVDYTAFADDELAKLFYMGQNEAFDELLLRHKDRLYSYISHIVKNDDMADDLFQETFVKAIMTLRQGRYQANGRFYNWLTRIAHNLLMDQFRAERNEPIVYNEEKEDLRNDYCDIVVQNRENEINNEQVLNDVRKLMDNLPENQREVVFMRFYQNMSFKEITDYTGMPLNTALGRMRYAIINMRKMANKNHISLNIGWLGWWSRLDFSDED